MVIQNDTLANLTANLTNRSFAPTTSSMGNETVKQAATQAGNFGLDKLLNMQWADGVAAWISQTTGIALTGTQLAMLVPVITLVFFYWKWGAVMNFIDQFGKIVLILAIIFVALKAFGVL
jgi:hypothetical protein